MGVKTTVDNFFTDDAVINDTIDTLKEITNYIANDKEGAADIAVKVGTLETKVDVEKVSVAISDAIKVETERATGVESELDGRVKNLEDNKANIDDIPTKTSELENDSEFITNEDLPVRSDEGKASVKGLDTESDAKRAFKIVIPNTSFKLATEPSLTYTVWVSSAKALYKENGIVKEIEVKTSTGASNDADGYFYIHNTDDINDSSRKVIHTIIYTISADGTVEVKRKDPSSGIKTDISSTCTTIKRVNNVTGVQGFAIGRTQDVSAQASFNIGGYNVNRGKYALMTGYNNENYSEGSLAGGTSSITTSASKYNLNISSNGIVEGNSNILTGRGVSNGLFRDIVLKDTYNANCTQITGSIVNIKTNDLLSYHQRKINHISEAHLIKGEGNIQGGISNVTVGNANVISGNSNYTQGEHNNTSGWQNYVLGSLNVVGGQNNFIQGTNLFADGIGLYLRSEHTLPKAAVGKLNIKYNTPDKDVNGEILNDEAPTFAVGNGGQYYQNINDEKDRITEVEYLELNTEEKNNYEAVRSNAFEVYPDGRAKVFGAPVNPEDVVRKQELDWFENELGLVRQSVDDRAQNILRDVQDQISLESDLRQSADNALQEQITNMGEQLQSSVPEFTYDEQTLTLTITIK